MLTSTCTYVISMILRYGWVGLGWGGMLTSTCTYVISMILRYGWVGVGWGGMLTSTCTYVISMILRHGWVGDFLGIPPWSITMFQHHLGNIVYFFQPLCANLSELLAIWTLVLPQSKGEPATIAIKLNHRIMFNICLV